ncbi:alpha/beta hydrolase [Dechloromonas sp. XY25]|uniref:Alpha/beta hydrolase n=1 Tax=Dechloromonas hankyongensis TaxID=2908002 RepID=A0ABS9K7C7_9RHOO|nr:alpha/beta hydrolase [Dechloromonas hankyongensis]MCG2579051.1 alpha/beta hydrolase [Dechloromonas hankyongensis]
MTTPPVLILPGLGDSGPAHWQSIWEASGPSFRRVVQRDWDHPQLAEWVATLQQHVAACETPPVLVAHSLACSLVAHWSREFGQHARGALLVSPSDVESPSHTPPEVRGFSPVPNMRFPFPSTVVASTDDPYVDIGRAEHFAQCWGSRFVVIPGAGHINAESGLGAWPEGMALLQELLRGNQDK